MTYILQDKHIVLGVTGSIACYKAADLASKLTQAGAQVDVVLTPSATQFITPLTFRSLTHRPVVTDAFAPESELSIQHVALAERADAVVIAPATANFLAKLAHGIADEALSMTMLATAAPLLVAPAMDAHMWDNAATQANTTTLKERGVTIVGPEEGRLASGLMGKGRLAETQEIIGHLCALLGRHGDLQGHKVVVGAGGTQEPIDPARVITNRSSGKMGYALAEAARDRGAEVVLVTAPTALPDPPAVRTHHVQTAGEMGDAVCREAENASALIMAAAPADFRPAQASPQKVKRGPIETWSLELTKTEDIIARAQGPRLIKVGFAAESEQVLQNARAKIQPKGLHLIAANDITATDSGFATDTNRVTLIDRDGHTEELPLLSKYEVAQRILDRVVLYFANP